MVPTAEVLALFGPTGVGKTSVAVALARRLRARGERPVAVSADALQVYAGLEVLTGAASSEEQAELEHRLVSFLPLTERFSAGRYAQLAHREIDELLDSGARPIVVGGTGLYLRAALAELSLAPPPRPGVRERWRAELDRVGPAALHELLASRAPQAAEQIDPTDPQRILRALELLDAGELRPGQLGRATGSDEGPSELWTEATRRTTLLAGLVMEREQLYLQIDTRVEQMLASGVVDEVRRASEAGVSETARKALGFDELLAGDVVAMKRRTRNYARRQLTWMRKLPNVLQVDVTGLGADAAAAEIERAWLSKR